MGYSLNRIQIEVCALFKFYQVKSQIRGKPRKSLIYNFCGVYLDMVKNN